MDILDLKLRIKSIIREMIIYRNSFIKDRNQKAKFDSLKKRLEECIVGLFPYYSLEFKQKIKEYPKILTDIIKTLGKISEYWMQLNSNINSEYNLNYNLEDTLNDIDTLIEEVSGYNYLNEKIY